MEGEKFKEELMALPLVGQVTLDNVNCITSAPNILIESGIALGKDFREYTCPYRLEALSSRAKLEGRVKSYHIPLILGDVVYKVEVAAKLLQDGQLLIVIRSAERYLEGVPSATVFRWLNAAGELEKITSSVIGNMVLVSVGDTIQEKVLWQKRRDLDSTGVSFYLTLKGESVGLLYSGKVRGEKSREKNMLTLPSVELQQSEYAKVNSKLIAGIDGVLHFYSSDLRHLATQVDYHPDQLNRPLDQLLGKHLAECGLEDSIWLPRKRLIEEAIATGYTVRSFRTHTWKGFEWLLEDVAWVLNNGEIAFNVRHGREWQRQAWACYTG